VGQREPQLTDPIVLAQAPTEMQPLIDALNRLFERIAGLLAAERRFNADAAHELRTPIAAIRAQTQVAIKAGLSPAREPALQAALVGCDRAAHLVDQLLMLAHVEASPQGFSQAVDLSEIARDIVAELAPMAAARQQGLDLLARAPCPIRGESSLLGVMVRNLVDNAIRYAPRAASIRIAVGVEDGHTVLSADDSGPGLSPEQMKRLGERFYRVLGTGQSGSGLGWSIVQRIAAAHGARTLVESSALLGGLSVRIHFPS
jgi:two-component system, OmpR family, sensor histidine kinase QseC